MEIHNALEKMEHCANLAIPDLVKCAMIIGIAILALAGAIAKIANSTRMRTAG